MKIEEVSKYIVFFDTEKHYSVEFFSQTLLWEFLGGSENVVRREGAYSLFILQGG